MHLDELHECTNDELTHAYAQLDALENVVRAQRLRVLAVIDDRDVARNDGAADLADWVAMRSRLRRASAKRAVDVARRLRDLPAIADAADTGRLSFDQLVPLTKLADAKTDADWAKDGPAYSPAQLDAIVTARRTVTDDDANDAHRLRAFRWSFDEQSLSWRFSGRMPDAMGATVVTALERIRAGQGRNPDGIWDAGDARGADALHDLAQTRLSNDDDAERASIVLHVPEHGAPTLADTDTPVAEQTARRLACDALVQALVKDALGNPVGLSRKRRTVSPALKRILRQRDRHCRFPGCERRRGVQAHHVVHHADGGVTDARNLVCLCPQHHRFLHEGHWRIEGDPTRPDGLVFRRPDGRAHPTTGPPLDASVRARILVS